MQLGQKEPGKSIWRKQGGEERVPFRDRKPKHLALYELPSLAASVSPQLIFHQFIGRRLAAIFFISGRIMKGKKRKERKSAGEPNVTSKTNWSKNTNHGFLSSRQLTAKSDLNILALLRNEIKQEKTR